MGLSSLHIDYKTFSYSFEYNNQPKKYKNIKLGYFFDILIFIHRKRAAAFAATPETNLH